jgi:hypothetical protein
MTDTFVNDPPALPGPATSWAPGEKPVGNADSVLPQNNFLQDAGYDPAKSAEVSHQLAGIEQKKLDATTWADRQSEGRLEQDRSRMDHAYRLEAASAEDPALRPWNAEQARSSMIRGPLEQFGSIGSIFAMAASAFTRQPMVSALNAGAAAMTAIHQSDEETYKSAYQAWKDNSNLALKRFDMERTLYEDANKLATTDMSLWQQKRLSIAAQYDDQKTVVLAQNGMVKEILENDAKKVEMADKLRKAQEGFEEFNFKKDIIADQSKAWLAGHPRPQPNDPNYPAWLQEFTRIKLLATAEAARATKGMQSGRTTADQEFIQRYYSEHPEATPEEFSNAFGEFKRGQRAPGGPGARTGTPSSDNAKRDAEIKTAHPDWTETQVIDERNRQIKEAKEAKPSLSADAVKLRANMLIKGNPAATTNVGRGVQGAADLRAITEEAAAVLKERGLDAEQAATLINENTAAFMGDKRGAAALALRSSQIIGASTVALNTMDRVLETSKKVSRTEFSDINKVLLAGEERVGDTNVINYGIALNTLINNYARAIGAGSNALTDTARREAHELLQKYWSQGQIESAIGQLKKELHDELRGAQEARKIWAEGGSSIPALGEGAVTAPPTKTPPVNLLKEGTISKMSDGSRWKLENGKAVQVSPATGGNNGK